MTPLSPRQQEVAALVVLGYSNKKIATTLQLTQHTVKEYVVRIGARLEGEGKPRAKIFRWWYEQRAA